MSATPHGETKIVLRQLALRQRNALTKIQALSLSRLVQKAALCFAPYLAAPAVTLYSAIEAEVATDAIRDHAWENGKTVFFPRSGPQSRPELAQVCGPAELRPGRFGILEPAGETRLEPGTLPLLFFIPGLAFDIRGNRLGRGIGWYDRLLRQWEGKATVVGLAYDFQIMGEVPSEPWDQKVHYLITDKRIVECGAAPSAVTRVS